MKKDRRGEKIEIKHPCNKCGSKIRYVSNLGCPICIMKRQENKWHFHIANRKTNKINVKIYLGNKPCKYCNSFLKFPAGNCYDCHNRREK